MAKVADEVMAPYDAIIGPTRNLVASPINQALSSEITGHSRDIMGAVGNGAGLPAISVPSGFTDNGLPTGIQFMGRAYDVNKVIAVARAYQSMTDWHKQHPSDVLP